MYSVTVKRTLGDALSLIARRCSSAVEYSTIAESVRESHTYTLTIVPNCANCSRTIRSMSDLPRISSCANGVHRTSTRFKVLDRLGGCTGWAVNHLASCCAAAAASGGLAAAAAASAA
ncbi:hypothetical protein [Samia ricini nucleopolyhedrovirus]|nr:hypothetical protein [Samia ricini nucleopolyhedrovirus]BBD51316.1 hypothetical protein [Samia ricini nucleopolyhedrovirus]BBD51468.1 hypothetical protein [Samia ricini nucleopolyhedrovirus]